MFAATAATIVSGAIAERCQFFAYFMYSIIITGEKTIHWGLNLLVVIVQSATDKIGGQL